MRNSISQYRIRHRSKNGLNISKLNFTVSRMVQGLTFSYIKVFLLFSIVLLPIGRSEIEKKTFFLSPSPSMFSAFLTPSPISITLFSDSSLTFSIFLHGRSIALTYVRHFFVDHQPFAVFEISYSLYLLRYPFLDTVTLKV